ncbi:hypothetical protein ACJJTC_011974, partial [Scirpophaga incertulas]
MPPVPPPRRHKISGERTSASPRPPSAEQRSPGLGQTLVQQNPTFSPNNHMTTPNQLPAIPPHLQGKIGPVQPTHLGSMPYLPSNVHAANAQLQTNTLGHIPPGWGRPRASLPGFNVPPNMQMPAETWDAIDNVATPGWSRPLRRGASVLELGGGMGMGMGGVGLGIGMGAGPCCGPWRYGSCASLDHQWGWPTCCPQQNPAQHHHIHAPFTPQPYRRDSRAMSRAASRACSRAASPAASTRSRTSRRARHRTPSPPPLPSSDADSENDSDAEPPRPNHYPVKAQAPMAVTKPEPVIEDSLGPAPEPPSSSWQCEHCTFVNEPGVRVCVICCRTPTTAPNAVDNTEEAKTSKSVEDSRNENAKSIDDSARAVATTARSIAHLDINDSVSSTSTSPVRFNGNVRVENGITPKNRPKSQKERTSTGCGPSPPREVIRHKSVNRLVTPSREQSIESIRSRHDMAVGSSPPKEAENSPPDTLTKENTLVRASPYRETSNKETPIRHNVSVGSSPPRQNITATVQKKSTGTSPPRNSSEIKPSSKSVRTNVSNTGTSPPPQSISTQTYEVPSTWEQPESRSRSRRRFREETRRERSHSRHSLSSDTRESDRGGDRAGRWEWRWGGDSSPGGEWSGSERRPPPRLARRASHLDLRRTRPPPRRDSFYGSEAASPEPTRAMSLEALAGQSAAAERGLELARLMTKAEQLGFSAAEVHAALAQRPSSPLRWLRERWAGLCAGVAAAAARLEPNARVSAREARAALARHRGAVWPAVTDCVRAHRTQVQSTTTNYLHDSEWRRGSLRPGAAIGPRMGLARRRRGRRRAAPRYSSRLPIATLLVAGFAATGGSSDEAEHHHDWSLPKHRRHSDWSPDPWDLSTGDASVPDIKRLLSSNPNHTLLSLLAHENPADPIIENDEIHTLELIQSENDFIEAYNALTRSTPLPGIEQQQNPIADIDPGRNKYNEAYEDTLSNYNAINKTTDQLIEKLKEDMDYQLQNHTITTQNEFPNHMMATNLPEEQPTIPASSHKDQKISGTSKIQNNVSHSSVPTPQVQNNKKLHSIRSNRNVRNKDYSQNQPNAVSDQGNAQAVTNKTTRSTEINNQESDKGNNLNQIVDNTQKLIQQMKEEINSDINSIDSRQISQSETDSSSNESSELLTEHESSYSESESDESEDGSSDNSKVAGEETDLPLPNDRPTIIERTSSEENEHFEEAMDHIEDQINEFKDTNIELLNSISRSLQEEHTISVAISEPKNIIKIKKQDQNNNVFVEVNNFEEIYAQLNSEIDKRPKTNENNNITIDSNNSNMSAEDNNSNNSNIDSTDITIKKLVPKYDLIVATFKPTSPTKLFISENLHSENKGTLETIEVEEMKEADSILDQSMEIIDLNKKQMAIQSSTDENIDENITSISPNSSQDGRSNMVQASSLTVFNDANDKSINEQPIISDINLDQTNQSNNDIYETVQNENMDNQEKDQTSSIVIDNTEKSEPAVSESAHENNINKVSNSLKSNIPKLIKLAHNIKQKDNKPAGKIISSKVPVRRGSLKQYPAPAPPKAHFGNIQSGHVKQLQTRLFNNKFPKSSMNIPSTSIIPKPSTSTLGKKKPAPPPPNTEQSSLNNNTPPSKDKKNNYFRESCRTDDEWSDSDSGDSQAQLAVKDTEPIRAPSPPPPVTVRRVSGQLIDLAKVQLPEGSPERQARMLLAQGATETWEQARLAVELAARGAEPAPALLAALDCADLTAALAYLQQECGLCAGHLPPHEMVSMLCCTHRCCRECARHYFTVQVSERSIADCVCPYCKEPELETMAEDAWLEYFAHLDILLKTLLDTEVHELFQRKLRDRTLALDPNFRWCVECSSGFFVHPKQKRVRCPECRNVSCAKCRKPWSSNHEGLTCEQYTAWLEDNDPERSMTAVQQHLQENGLECPRCHFKYSLSRGGCMHFTCTQCKFEFCYGCGKPFTMGARCGLSEYCAKLGLHAHHPRNCLFYLRDKEPHQLQTLLQMNDVPFETEAPEGSTNRCPIQLQRETPTGLVDGVCGNEVPPNHAGLCKLHYVEYLAMRARNLDPIPVMELADLIAELRRRALPLPERGPWDSDPIYAAMCAE